MKTRAAIHRIFRGQACIRDRCFMAVAKRTFTLNAILSEELDREVWPRKSIGEAVQFLISIKPWLPLFVERHGELIELTSLDGVDDPPDIQVTFINSTVNFEMTKLLPEQFGRYDAILREFAPEQMVHMLNLSSNVPLYRKNLEQYAVSQSGTQWANPDAEIKLWEKEAQAQYERKMQHHVGGFLIMHADPRHISDPYLGKVVSFLDRLVQEGPADRPGVLVSHTSFGHNRSWLLEKAQAPATRFSSETYTKTGSKPYTSDRD
jgi:hypothetical protein